jgi:hypothetical protein
MGGSDGGGGQATQSSQQANAAQMQEAQIAQDQWDRYKQLYSPLEQQYVAESQNLGSQANQNKAAQKAGADVAAQFAGAREQLRKTPGVDPGSQAYLEAQNKLNLAEAADSAAAQTGARQNVVQQGRAAETDALSMGKGLPATAMTGLAQAGTGLQRASEFWQQQANNTGANIGKTIAGITDSAGFKNWMNGGASVQNILNSANGSDVGGGYVDAGTVPGGYVDSSGTVFNNPSAYVPG